jgi:nitrilase
MMEDDGDEIVVGEGGEVLSNGGSVIFDPLGNILAGPLWGSAGLLKARIENVEEAVMRGKLDLDTAMGGHYAR